MTHSDTGKFSPPSIMRDAILELDVKSIKTSNLRLEPSCRLDDKQKEDEEWEMDPKNAYNWPRLRKWTVVTIVALYASMPNIAIAMIAPALPKIAEKYHVHNPTISALVLSVSLLTYIFGPLVLVPLSEMYGRVWVVNVCSIFATIFSFGCAFSPNVGTLIAFRALYGFVASTPPDVGVAVVSDIFPEKHRATPMAMYHIGLMIGPFIGPIVGGYMAQTTNLQWIFILLAVFSGALTLLGVILLQETYAPVIRMRQAKRENNIKKAARAHPMLLGARADLVTLLWINLKRPLMLLFRSYICFILSVFLALLYGLFFLLVTTFPRLYGHTYGFKSGAIGLAYSGLGLGHISAMIVGGKWANYVYIHLAEKNGGKGKPEMRMPAIIPGSILVSVGLLLFGWSAQAKLHLIMPVIGSSIFGFGLMTGVLGITLYLADAFPYAASAFAAASVFKSIFGFTFPLFGTQMYDALGQGVANSFARWFSNPFWYTVSHLYLLQRRGHPGQELLDD